MTTLPGARRFSLLAICAVLLAGLAGQPARADSFGPDWLKGVYDGEIGLRYWLSTGQTGKRLYNFGGSAMVSRLTYRGLIGQSGELFGQINERNYFLKGVAGMGGLMRGTLQDEDFPPYIKPYSSTDSSLGNGELSYATLDGGGYFYEQPNARAGVFFGYNYFHEGVNGFGCNQTATNAAVCGTTSIPTSVAVITQQNNWHSLRVGLNGDMRLGGWRLTGEAALLPVVDLQGADYHWLRICKSAGCFKGGVPEDGFGWGYQLEAMADYTVANKYTFGIGGRYWHMESSGFTNFEGNVVGGGGGAQPVKWSTDLFGVTAHASLQY